MRTLILVISLFATLNAYAQDGYKNFIEEVISNNLQIKTLTQELEANKVGHRTGLNPDDPEVDLAYFINRGKTMEFTVAQKFDFPTVYINRSKMADLVTQKSVLEFLQGRREVISDAITLYIGAVYLNKKIAFLEKSLSNAQKVKSIYDKRVESGDATVLEKNKVEAMLLETSANLQQARMSVDNNLRMLEQINGGRTVVINQTDYPLFDIPSSGDEFIKDALDRDYTVALAAIDTTISQREIKLNRSLWIPGVKVGYRLDTDRGAMNNGVVAGLTIPLWQNRNKLKYAKMQQKTAVSRSVSVNSSVEAYLETLLNSFNEYNSIYGQYKEFLSKANNVDIINKALSAGEISMLEYIVELNLWYDMNYALIEAEKNLCSVMGAMSSYRID